MRPTASNHGGLHALGALHALLARGLRLGLVEDFGADGVGEGRRGAPLIDRRLGALGLERVEDRRELRDLRLVEFELEREETQRAADAEAPATEVVTPAAAVGPVTVPMIERPAAVVPPAGASVLVVAVGTATRVSAAFLAAGVPTAVKETKHSRMHFVPLAGAHRAQRVLSARDELPRVGAGSSHRASSMCNAVASCQCARGKAAGRAAI